MTRPRFEPGFAGIASSNPHGCLVSYECSVLSGRGFCVGLITDRECGVSDSDRETSIMKRPWWPTRDCWAVKKKILNPSIERHRHVDPFRLFLWMWSHKRGH